MGPQKAVTVPASREPHCAGVLLAQQQEVEGFDDGDGECQPHSDRREEQGELSPRDVAQRPHRPDDEALQGLLATQVLENLHHGTDSRGEHHAQD